MRVTLIHNPSAGTDDHRAEELVGLLRDAGHDVHLGTMEAITRALPATDLILAAGGDGTVHKIAQKMMGRDTPVGILPLGTANNLARSLDLERPVEEIIANLDRYEPRRMGVGSAVGPWGERRFLEGFGVGLFADYLAFLQRPANRDWMEALREEQGMDRDYVFLPQLLGGYAAREWELRIDGERVDGEYFLVEAMNTTCLGPFSELVPPANPVDGWLHLVALGDQDLAGFSGTLQRRAAGENAPFRARSRRFRELELRSRDEFVHFDDRLWPKSGEHSEPAIIHVSVRRDGPYFLCPPREGADKTPGPTARVPA